MNKGANWTLTWSLVVPGSYIPNDQQNLVFIWRKLVGHGKAMQDGSLQLWLWAYQCQRGGHYIHIQQDWVPVLYCLTTLITTMLGGGGREGWGKKWWGIYLWGYGVQEKQMDGYGPPPPSPTPYTYILYTCTRKSSFLTEHANLLLLFCSLVLRVLSITHMDMEVDDH